MANLVGFLIVGLLGLDVLRLRLVRERCGLGLGVMVVMAASFASTARMALWMLIISAAWSGWE